MEWSAKWGAGYGRGIYLPSDRNAEVEHQFWALLGLSRVDEDCSVVCVKLLSRAAQFPITSVLTSLPTHDRIKLIKTLIMPMIKSHQPGSSAYGLWPSPSHISILSLSLHLRDGTSNAYCLLFKVLLWLNVPPLEKRIHRIPNPLVPQNVTLFWNRVIADVIVKMRSSWGRLGP